MHGDQPISTNRPLPIGTNRLNVDALHRQGSTYAPPVVILHRLASPPLACRVVKTTHSALGALGVALSRDRPEAPTLPNVAKIETEPPAWRQVYAEMSKRIRTGTIPVGERVPSLVQLTAEFGIASATGMKVMRSLRENGLIRTVPGRGSFVAEPRHWEPE